MKSLTVEPIPPPDADAEILAGRLRAAMNRGVTVARASEGCGACEASIYRWRAGHVPVPRYRAKLRAWLDTIGAVDVAPMPAAMLACGSVPDGPVVERLRAAIDGGVPRVVAARALGCDESTIRAWFRGHMPSARFTTAINAWIDGLDTRATQQEEDMPTPHPSHAEMVAMLRAMIRMLGGEDDPAPQLTLPAPVPPPPPPPHPADIAIERLRAAVGRGVTVAQVRDGVGAHPRSVRSWLAGEHPPPYRLAFLVRFLDSLEGAK